MLHDARGSPQVTDGQGRTDCSVFPAQGICQGAVLVLEILGGEMCKRLCLLLLVLLHLRWASVDVNELAGDLGHMIKAFSF